MPLKPDTLHDELSRQPLCAFTGMGKPGEDVAYVNANLYAEGLVRIRMRGAGMEMTKEQFLSFCREGVRVLEKLK